MNIRKFQEKDRENCKQICIDTCHYKLKTQKDIDKLHLFCLNYYINEEADNCFVAVDEEDSAVGYILCSQDFNQYKKVFREKYLTKEHSATLFDKTKHYLECMINYKVVKDYPAHMHIDIFPSHQKMGLGHKLVDAVCQNLKEKKVKGLFLRCVKSNKKGINFYKKYGFKLLSTKITALFALDIF